MNLKSSTVLITGGTSGIGLEFAKQLSREGATVIVTGRDMTRLVQAKQMIPALHIFQCNVSNADDIASLYNLMIAHFPNLNILINNAGIMRSEAFNTQADDSGDITTEIDINFSGTVRMVHRFLPHLKRKNNAAIVNISSGLAFIPFIISPIYCGTKAAIHTYSMGLREQLKNTSVKVFEVAPPKTDKPMQTAVPEANTSGRTMRVDQMVSVAIKGIKNDRYEIRPGLSNVMKWMSRIAPAFFTTVINNNIRKQLKQNKVK